MNTQTTLFLSNQMLPTPIAIDLSVDRPTLICFSDVRYDFISRRTQHLLTCVAKDYRVLLIEEPMIASGPSHFRMQVTAEGVIKAVPVFDAACDPIDEQKMLLHRLQQSLVASIVLHWYCTPMSLSFSRDLRKDLCVYDCTDELSAIQAAPRGIVGLEDELLHRADLVFTDGRSLCAAKRRHHADVHCFPSGADDAHFSRARHQINEPCDQKTIPNPRIGYIGEINERIDLDLIATVSAALPQIQFVMIGPITTMNADDLPRADNLHWLGGKAYEDLPAYLSSWQAAWMPFALNDATRFLSPTQTPAYLAAGLRVVATPVTDVVDTYGKTGFVSIADAKTIIPVLKTALGTPPKGWLLAVDKQLALMSSAQTWDAMRRLITDRLSVRQVA